MTYNLQVLRNLNASYWDFSDIQTYKISRSHTKLMNGTTTNLIKGLSRP
jgi:hypothetical protein